MNRSMFLKIGIDRRSSAVSKRKQPMKKYEKEDKATSKEKVNQLTFLNKEEIQKLTTTKRKAHRAYRATIFWKNSLKEMFSHLHVMNGQINPLKMSIGNSMANATPLISGNRVVRKNTPKAKVETASTRIKQALILTYPKERAIIVIIVQGKAQKWGMAKMTRVCELRP